MSAQGEAERKNASDVRCFPTTRWSLVARAGGQDDGACREALGALLRRYLPALRAHLRARGITADRADELLQSFIADRVIERDLLASADRGRGKFRWFLATALNHFAANQLRADTAAKRSPAGGKVLALDEHHRDDPRIARTSADAFDVAWAREVTAEALRQMRDECQGSARSDMWEVFQGRILAPAFGGAEPTPYDELIRRFGYASPAQASNVLITAKRMFERNLRFVISEYVNDEQELEEELLSLREILTQARPGPADQPGAGSAGAVS